MKLVNEMLKCIVLILCIFCLIKYLYIPREDVNRDGNVDSRDLLQVKQYLLNH